MRYSIVHSPPLPARRCCGPGGLRGDGGYHVPARGAHSMSRKAHRGPDLGVSAIAFTGCFRTTGGGSLGLAVLVSTDRTATIRCRPRSCSTLTCIVVPAGTET